MIHEYRLGFSPAGGGSLLKAATAKGYYSRRTARAGLILDGEGSTYDRFRGRLMFPFTDHRGRVLGFGARVLDDSKPKYLNSPGLRALSQDQPRLRAGQRPRRRSPKRTASSSSRATPTCWRCIRPASPTPSPPWARRSPSSSCKEISRFTRNIYPGLRRRCRRPGRHAARARAGQKAEPDRAGRRDARRARTRPIWCWPRAAPSAFAELGRLRADVARIPGPGDAGCVPIWRAPRAGWRPSRR